MPLCVDWAKHRGYQSGESENLKNECSDRPVAGVFILGEFLGWLAEVAATFV
ncbi:MAG: hypothetical protein KatS3mg110_0968 [Pirellulaceae bacterium]|nr:MAG: hypothetical protein KatS3mg110_0968 [Pirellulaceae bacterium]